MAVSLISGVNRMSDHHDDHDHEHDHEVEEMDTVILTDEDGNEHEFLHLDTLEVEGSTYFILMPMVGETEDGETDEEADEEADEAVIFKLGHDAEGNEMLLDIEDDEEWEKVADVWEAMDEE